MSAEATWTPIITGTNVETARAAINEIADGLRAVYRGDAPADQLTMVKDSSLSGGTSGVALFFAYLADMTEEPADLELAAELLDSAIDAVAEQQMMEALHGGFSGIAWAVEHLGSLLYEPDEDEGDSNEGIDEALADRLAQTPWLGDYDLIGGLVGLGVYALERPAEQSSRCLLPLFERLDELCDETKEGIRWHTRAELLPPWQREIAPEGYYNLGLAHGMPGIIALLGQAIAVDRCTPRGRELLEGAVNWILAQRDDHPTGMFSSWVVPGQESSGSRAAWCYGDPGVALPILRAARATGNSEWERSAIDCALAVAARDKDLAGVNDAGICHGSAGLGHILNRLYQATGEESLREAAAYWLLATPNYRREGVGIAGYASYTPGSDSEWRADLGLLTGAAGVGLALLAGIQPTVPGWDRCLLMDL